MKAKSILCALLTIVCLVTAVAPAYAAEPSTNSMLRWSYVSRVELDIYFNAGKGTVVGKVVGNSVVTRIAGEVNLYYKNIYYQKHQMTRITSLK